MFMFTKASLAWYQHTCHLDATRACHWRVRKQCSKKSMCLLSTKNCYTEKMMISFFQLCLLCVVCFSPYGVIQKEHSPHTTGALAPAPSACLHLLASHLHHYSSPIPTEQCTQQRLKCFPMQQLNRKRHNGHQQHPSVGCRNSQYRTLPSKPNTPPHSHHYHLLSPQDTNFDTNSCLLPRSSASS